MKVVPATVKVPARFVVELFGATMKLTAPGPDPEPPPVTVIQLSLLAAPQAQPEPAVTALPPVPPAAVNA